LTTPADPTYVSLREHLESRILAVEETALARIQEIERATVLLATEASSRWDALQTTHVTAHDKEHHSHQKEHEASERAILLASNNLDLRLEKLNELRKLVSDLQSGYVPLPQFTQINDRLWERISSLETWKASIASIEPAIKAHTDRLTAVERTALSRDVYDTTVGQWQTWRNGVEVTFQQLVNRSVFDKTVDLLEEKISALSLADREAMTRVEFEALVQRQADERAANRRGLNASLIFAVVAVVGMLINVAVNYQ
jgi:hypothetical protein